MAHRVVDGIFGPRTIKTETVATGSPASAGVVGPAVLSANSLGRDACNVPAKAFLDVCCCFFFSSWFCSLLLKLSLRIIILKFYVFGRYILNLQVTLVL